MIQHLAGNEGTSEAVQGSLGKTISGIRINKEADPEELCIAFTDGTELVITDQGQSCCESRYMSLVGDFTYHIGAQLVKVEEAEGAQPLEEEYNVHEIVFLKVDTTKGGFTFATHNEHNGYYGGFDLRAKVRKVGE